MWLCQKVSSRVLNFPYISLYFFPRTIFSSSSRRISIQTLLFQACLPTRQNGVENRGKAYHRIVDNSEVSRLLFDSSGENSLLYESSKPFIMLQIENKYPFDA